MSRSFTAVTHRVDSGYSTHGTQRSWGCWTYRTGDGVMIWAKRNSGLSVMEFLANSAGAGTYVFRRDWTTSGLAQWSIARPSLNVWHHILVTYDAGATSNDPVIYVDGVSVTVTEDIAPTGTPSTSASTYWIGNSGDADEAWTGRLADFAIWDAILSASEAMALGRGVNPNRVRRGSLVRYFPLFGKNSPEPDYSGNVGSGTVTGTAIADHAPVAPWGFDESWVSAAAAGGGGGSIQPPRTMHQARLRRVA